jgi:hypothetical protein
MLVALVAAAMWFHNDGLSPFRFIGAGFFYLYRIKINFKTAEFN